MRIDLSRQNLGDTELRERLDALDAVLVKEIDLSYNQAGIETLNAHRRFSSLTTVTLADNALPKEYPRYLIELLENSHLDNLVLAFNPTEQQLCREMIRVMHNQNTLRSLVMRSLDLSKTALPKCGFPISLEKLVLTDNELDSSVFLCLARCLRHLKDLQLASNPIEIFEHLLGAAPSFDRLEHINLDECEISGNLNPHLSDFLLKSSPPKKA